MCDLKDMPKNVKDVMKIHFVETMDEVLEIALTKEIPGMGKKSMPLDPDVPENEEEREESQDPPVTH